MEGAPKVPHLFLKTTGSDALEESREVSRRHLVNKLNFLHFQNRTIQVNLKHLQFHRTVTRHARPQPCLGDRVDCLWAEPGTSAQDLTSYQVQSFLIADGRDFLLVRPRETTLGADRVSFLLPETCNVVRTRKVKRHACDGVAVQLVQNSALFHGVLVDFNASSFCIEIVAQPPQTFQWINSETPVRIQFLVGAETLYSNECTILRQSCHQKRRELVLQPLHRQIPRYRPKEFRSTRQQLVPSPNLLFRHPFTGKIVDLKVIDISGTGLSVEESESHAVLLPGMIIPEAEINFAESLTFTCRAQVVYCNPGATPEEPSPKVKCGLAILDMDIQDHVRLLSLIYQANDRNSYLCSKIDLDALWNFFFETGFIYPEKYAHIHASRESLKETYQKLYTRHPSIARHFIYQDKGTILGHMGMVRFYENSWLIHHHAASRQDSRRAGVAVLNQIGRFINDSHSLSSVHMNFVMCYFRPENKFPARVFGGIANSIGDPKACSLDSFAYFHFRKTPAADWNLPAPWELTAVDREDLLDLQACYEQESGGLLINALDLEPDLADHEGLSHEYERLGFRRERFLFALKKDGRTRAVIQLNLSDIGLNMSDLTNCIQIFVLDSTDLPPNILYLLLSLLSVKYDTELIPVLLMPADYARSNRIPVEKHYQLWILNMNHTDPYFSYLQRLLRHIQH